MDELVERLPSSPPASLSLPPFVKTIEYRVQALQQSYGLIDHYFLVIDDMEFHLGQYKLGSILPAGTTKGAHTLNVRKICEFCYNKIIADINYREDLRLISYYPILNCESLATGFSVQSLGFLALPFILTLTILQHYYLAIIIFLLTIIFLLAYSKYIFSRTIKSKCIHLQQNEIQRPHHHQQ